MNKMKMMKEIAHYAMKRLKLLFLMHLGSSPSFSLVKKIAAEDGGAGAGVRGVVGDG
ncbi:unnamed protein product [Prunus brigantina]